MKPRTFLFFIISLLWLIPLAGTVWNHFRFVRSNEKVFDTIKQGLHEIRFLFWERSEQLRNLDRRLRRLEGEK